MSIKNLLRLPVLLLAMMLVASCGDSKKDDEKKLSPVEQAAADGYKYGELMCKFKTTQDNEDALKLQQELQKFGEEVEKKWEGKEASEILEKAFEKAMEVAMDNCK